MVTRWLLASFHDDLIAHENEAESSKDQEESPAAGSGEEKKAARVALWSFLRDIKSERMSMDFDSKVRIQTSADRIDLSLLTGNNKSRKDGSVVCLSNVYYLVDLFYAFVDIKEATAESATAAAETRRA